MNEVSKTYRRAEGVLVKAVDQVSLSIPSGEIVGLLGPSSAGKTTILKMLAGLEPPTTGVIRLKGHDVVSDRAAAIQQVGAVIQGKETLSPQRTVWENLLQLGRQRGCSNAALIASTEDILRTFELQTHRDDPIGCLSFETRQKVAMAGAFVADSAIGLLDELTWVLEGLTSGSFKALICRLAREKSMTVVIATRQPSLAQELCNRVLILSQGRLAADFPVTRKLTLCQETYCEIKVDGRIAPNREAWFSGLTVKPVGRQTTLSGRVPDQAALHGLLGKIRDLGLPLLSVWCNDPKLEDALGSLLEQTET